MKSFTALIAVLLFLSTQNTQALEVGVEGGLNFWNSSNTSAVSTLSYTNATSAAFVAGAYLKGNLNFLFDAEIGLYYMNKKTTETASGTYQGQAVSSNTAVQTSSYIIPLIFRTNFFPGDLVNVGAGVYYEIDTSGGVNENGVNESYAAAGVNHNDIGLIGSAQFMFPIAPFIHVLADARYLHGLNEQSTNTAMESSKNGYLQFLAGLSLGI